MAARRARRSFNRGAEYVVDFLPKIKIEVVIADDQLAAAIGGHRQFRAYRPHRRRQDLHFRNRRRHAHPDGRNRARRHLTSTTIRDR